MSAWVIWVIAAAVLAAAESLSLDLVLIMLAGGAGAGAIAAAVGANTLVQFLVALAGSVALLGGLRPIAKRHLTRESPVKFGVASLIGMEAIVVEPVNQRDGRIKLNGSLWSARTEYDGTPIAPGETVRVLAIHGATAVVYPDTV